MSDKARTEPEDGPESAMTRREWLAIGVVVALALALRLIYLHEVRHHPLFTTLLGDPAIYLAQAGDIAAGKPVPDHAYFHSSPLYPFFLALVSKLGGSSLHAVRVVQSLFGAATVALMFALGRMTLGRRAGLAAAVLTAVYVPFVFFEAEFLEITLVITFVVGSLVLLELADRRGSIWTTVAAGALLGAAGLGKPNLLLFAPAGSLWLARGAWRRSRRSRSRGMHDDREGRGRRRSGDDDTRAARNPWLLGALFFVSAGLVVLPATVHNYRTEGDFIPVSSNGGINFFIGNHTGSPGVFQVPPEMRFDLRVASQLAAERETGREMSAGEVSDFWTARTVEQIRANPGRWLSLMGRKFALFWNHYEIPNHYHLYYVRQFAPVLRFPVGTFGVVAPLGLFGIGLALLRRKRVGLLVLFGLTFMASVLPFFITGRYRLAIAPVLLVGAGFAVVELWRAVLSREWRTLAAAAVVIAALGVAVGIETIEFSFAPMHNAVGGILGERGDMEGAVVEFERALELRPTDLSSRYNLGLALLSLGRFDEAAVHFERALEGHPRYHDAWVGLGRARAGTGRFEEAREAWQRVTDADPPAPERTRAEAAALLRELAATAGSDEPETDR